MDDETPAVRDLLAAREVLKSCIEESRNVSIAVDGIGLRLLGLQRNFGCLQAAVKNVARKCAVYGIRDDVGRALGPAAGALRVMDLVFELRDSLESGRGDADLFDYINNFRRLEDALKLLSSNCGLLILWMEDVLQFLRNNVSYDDEGWFFDRVSKILEVLVELQGMEDLFRREGGVLLTACNNLEREFENILKGAEFRFLGDSCLEPVIVELQSVAEVLEENNRLDRCLSVYAEARIENSRATLQALNLDYLEIESSEGVSVQTMVDYVDLWDEHMEFSVRHLLRKEFALCRKVFERFGSDVSTCLFADIAIKSGFMEILEFGNTVCKCKKEAIKLLKLIKIFSTMDKLRLDFNDLFVGKHCLKIQNQTRELVKKVVDGACEIFWELSAQVELQREFDPPPDGSVPTLVDFVIEYCSYLLDDENISILTGILEIYQVWNQVKFGDGIVSNEIRNIIKAVEINVEIWAKGYDDTALSYLFMMNNHSYLCNETRKSKLGDLMGSSWLWAYDESAEYYAGLYMRESWEKLLEFLQEEDLTLFPGGRAFDRNLVDERVVAFCETFDDMYKKQSKWKLYDKGLRWKTCQMVVETVVRPYKNFLQKYMPGVEHENELTNRVMYTAESLENMISALFQQKIGVYGSVKCTDMIGIKNSGVTHFPSTPAAA
ncbi:exocyst complex component EXO70A1-like [Andrographis paniculata]|uniref:exocyst complex component EXO70A1-like n=1 Tax=Andrographis paniculata TaxID=175694 RepID=UPI0021E8C429|nr:exocyst complex component EXO70A1-like [Andrographis paniculata]